MVRGIGCIMTVAGCIGLGVWYRRQFIGRLYHVRILISILDMMMSQVRYSKSTLSECCLYLAERLEEPYCSTFQGIWENFEANTEEAFGELFEQGMKVCLEQVPLEKEERMLFLELAGNCGYEDAGMQLRSMEQYRDRLEELSQKLSEEVAEKGRMAVSLGSLGGLLLLIILL